MLGESLRLIRSFHEITQMDLAKDLGISRSYLSELEAGKKKPSLDLLESYSARFDIPLSSIILFSEKSNEGRYEGATRKILTEKALVLLRWIEAKAGIKDAA